MLQNSSEIEDPAWKALYKIGGVAALMAVFVFRRNLAAELMLLGSLGIINDVPATPPSNAHEWFTLLQANKFVGLILLDFFDLLEYFLVGLIFLALYFALKQVNRTAMLTGVTCGLVGIAVSFISNQAFAMLSVSEQYTEATTDAQRSYFLEAGEALLAKTNPDATYQGVGVYVGLFLVLLAGLMISVVMLRSDIFSKATAVTGILANGIGLCFFITLVFAPAIYWIPIPISAPFRVIWYFLIALRLFKLGKTQKKE